MIKKILILAPHTDDGEFGCGGTAAKFIEERKEVFYAAFSICEESVPKNMSPDTLLKEVRQATHVLGVRPQSLYTFKFPVRRFPQYRQEILEEMVLLKKNIKPDLVFMPSLSDLHQDHRTVAEEGLRVFKEASVLSYEIPWNNMIFRNSCFSALERRHLEKKIAALKCYKSQGLRKYADQDFFLSLAKVRGVQSGHKYAEVFEIVRWQLL